jgi:hypothetical protein
LGRTCSTSSAALSSQYAQRRATGAHPVESALHVVEDRVAARVAELEQALAFRDPVRVRARGIDLGLERPQPRRRRVAQRDVREQDHVGW